MNPEVEKSVKKFNRIYVIELFVIAAIALVIATLKITEVIKSSPTSRHVFNIITLIGGGFIIADFIWLCSSKKRQKRNCWFDKISVLPLAIAMITYDIICIINWNEPSLSYASIFVGSAFYYLAAVYIAQGIYHFNRPLPSVVQDAIKEYNQQQAIQPGVEVENKPDEEIKK